MELLLECWTLGSPPRIAIGKSGLALAFYQKSTGNSDVGAHAIERFWWKLWFCSTKNFLFHHTAPQLFTGSGIYESNLIVQDIGTIWSLIMGDAHAITWPAGLPKVFSSSIRFNICQLVTGQPTLLVDHLIRELWPNFTWNYWKSSCRSDEYFKWEPSQHFLTCSNSHFSMPPSPTSKDEMLAFIVKYLSSWKGLARHFRTTTVVDKHGLHFHSWITCVGSVQ